MMVRTNRRINIGKLGGALMALAAVLAIIWPQYAEKITQLAAALGVLALALAAMLTVTDVAEIHANAATEQERVISNTEVQKHEITVSAAMEKEPQI